MKSHKRVLGNGREIHIGRNHGIRKICACPNKKKAQCPHPWHFNFAWKGRAYRLSLDRHVGHRVETRSDAEGVAAEIRAAIRAGTFESGDGNQVIAEQPTPSLTFRKFAEEWQNRRGYQLVRPRENEYRLKQISAFVLPGTAPPQAFGDKTADQVTAGDIEAYRHHRRTEGVSPVTSNHDLKLLRKMFAWGVRERLIPATPFKVSTETVIKLDPETPRERRFKTDKEEAALLKAAEPQLRAVIVAMLDTCCRPGELLSLQWRDVDLEQRLVTIRAEKTKTRRGRVLPISARLLSVLQMRRLDPSGKELGPDAYVFGDEVGRSKSVRAQWERARAAAGLGNFHLADLRHEAASRFEEAGVPTTYVSKFLGHGNLSTTTRYLNATIRGLRLALQKLEETRTPSQPKAKKGRSRRPNSENLASGLQAATRKPARTPASGDMTFVSKSFTS